MQNPFYSRSSTGHHRQRDLAVVIPQISTPAFSQNSTGTAAPYNADNGIYQTDPRIHTHNPTTAAPIQKVNFLSNFAFEMHQQNMFLFISSFVSLIQHRNLSIKKFLI